MSAEPIKVELLDCGIRAAFINLPHFRTHSARLTINSGSAHEMQNEHGAAHFLEHVTFQGTEDFPNEADVYKFSEDKGLNKNAFTNQMYTTYVADGFELNSVGHFLTQLAFKPRLTDDSLEGERKPIIDEIRGYASSPYYDVIKEHDRALRGDIYARPIGGTIEDVQNMKSESIVNYYQRNYCIGNAVLVICSAEHIAQQKKYVEDLLSGHLTDVKGEPSFVEFDKFNPNRISASLQKVDLPLAAQSNVSICYDIPETNNIYTNYDNKLISFILTKAANNKLRRELALCYGANANLSKNSDLNFGRERSWSHISINVNLNGEDAIFGLDTMLKEVIHKPLPEKELDSILVSLQRDLDKILQSDPAQIANKISNVLANSNRDEIMFDEVEKYAKAVSLDKLRKIHKEIVETKPLILATSPDQKVLDQIGEWSTNI